MGDLIGDRPPREVTVGKARPGKIGKPAENVTVKRQKKPKTLESFVLSNYVHPDGTNSIDLIQGALEKYQAEINQLKETILVLKDGPPPPSEDDGDKKDKKKEGLDDGTEEEEGTKDSD